MLEAFEVIVVLSLIGLNVFQAVHWSRQVQTLVDKLMSRNYAEYSTLAQPKEQVQKVRPPMEPELPDDLRVLQGFNA